MKTRYYMLLPGAPTYPGAAWAQAYAPAHDDPEVAGRAPFSTATVITWLRGLLSRPLRVAPPVRTEGDVRALIPSAADPLAKVRPFAWNAAESLAPGDFNRGMAGLAAFAAFNAQRQFNYYDRSSRPPGGAAVVS